MTGWMSPTHLLIVLVLVVILFGSKRLPDAARGLGRSLRILKSEVKQMSEENTADSATRELPHGSAAPAANPTVENQTHDPKQA